MATIQPTVAQVQTFGSRGAHVITWAPMTQSGSDVGAPIEMPGWADRSVQVTGTLGTGGNVRIEGSNDGTNYATLNDPQGNALDVNSLKVEQILEITRYIRPRVTAGDGTTSLAVSLLIVRNA
jgi:hypothetical protein